MLGAAQRGLDVWRRRRWRPDPVQLAGFEGLRPVVLVTGGSDGIGLALARRFAAAGHDLLLVARDASKLAAAARSIGGPVRIAVLPLDLASSDAVLSIDTCLAREKVYVDILVQSAGVGLAGPFAGHSESDLARLVDLNMRAVTVLSRHCLPGMLARGRGGILTIASLGAWAPGPWQAAYYASKAYVTSLSEALAAECSGQGVRITVVLPGPVSTGFHRRMGGETGLYLRLLPVATPQAVANTAYRGFRWGCRVVMPGLATPVLGIALRILPHRLSSAVIGFLLKPRA